MGNMINNIDLKLTKIMFNDLGKQVYINNWITVLGKFRDPLIGIVDSDNILFEF